MCRFGNCYSLKTDHCLQCQTQNSTSDDSRGADWELQHEQLATVNISLLALTLNFPRKPRRLARFCSVKCEKRQNLI